MTDSTPTGILIAPCVTCGRRHPVSRRHCGTCGLALLFRCAVSNCDLGERGQAGP